MRLVQLLLAFDLIETEMLPHVSFIRRRSTSYALFVPSLFVCGAAGTLDEGCVLTLKMSGTRTY